MIYRKISAPVFFIFIFIFLLQGCSDDGISPSNSTVTGRVFNAAKIPVPGLKVKIGNESAVTDKSGSYSLKNSTYPYDILVVDELSRSQMLIKSISKQFVIIPGFITSTSPESIFRLSVTLPAGFIHPGKKGKLIFTNGYTINSSMDIVSDSTLLEIRMNMSGSKGKMIIITYLTDDSDNILSYENYYENADVVSVPDITMHYDIDSSQLSFNPDERTLNGRIIIPPGYNYSEQYFYLNFASHNTPFNTPDCKFSLINGNDFNIIVPADLPSDFSVMINNYINTPGGGDKYSLEAFKVQKNSSTVILNAKLPPDLISPPDNAVDVNPNTEISHTAGEGSGVTITRLYQDGKIFSVVSSSESFLFSEMSKFEIGEISNKYFFWTVQKYGEVPDLETYLTWFPSGEGEFLSKGEQRMFRAAP